MAQPIKAPKNVKEEDVKALLDPDFFYNHGDNPAHKKLIEVVRANTYNGKIPEFRSTIIDTKARWLMARNLDDLLQRDFKVYTAPRALIVLTAATAALVNVIGTTNRLLPIGQFGITKVSQIPFYHKFGRIPTYAVALAPFLAFYAWFKVSSFCTRRIWNNVVLQEREWQYETNRRSIYGQYYFEDTPLATQGSMPQLAGHLFGNVGDKLPTAKWTTKDIQ